MFSCVRGQCAQRVCLHLQARLAQASAEQHGLSRRAARVAHVNSAPSSMDAPPKRVAVAGRAAAAAKAKVVSVDDKIGGKMGVAAAGADADKENNGAPPVSPKSSPKAGQVFNTLVLTPTTISRTLAKARCPALRPARKELPGARLPACCRALARATLS